MLNLTNHLELTKETIDSQNLCHIFTDEDLHKIGEYVCDSYEMDKQSREPWLRRNSAGMDLAMQVQKDKNFPWPGSSNIAFPLITIAALQFHSRAYPAIIPGVDVVGCRVIGDDPDGSKTLRAERVSKHMSWQLLSEMKEWEPQTDRLLLVAPIVGTMFRKTYFDPGQQRNVSETVTADMLCVNYHAKSFEAAPRKTEVIPLYPWDIESNIRGGLFLDEYYGVDTDAGQDEDAPVTFLEQHRRWDLDEDGYAEPYIVTIARDSGKLARITAGYDAHTVFYGPDHRIRKIEAVDYYTKYGFIPAPDNTVYDIGFGHLLFPINDAINTTVNQLFDAGHLANVGGGFIGSGLSMNSGTVRFQMGEFKQVNTQSGSLRDNVLPLPFPGPNVVLLELLKFLVDSGREIAAVKDVLSGEAMGANTPATTILAMIEQGLKIFSAIQKRILRSLKSELDKLFRLNRLYLPDRSGFQDSGAWQEVKRADYMEGTGVEPVSDPTMLTDMQRLGRAQFLLQFADDPMFNPLEVRRRVLEAAQVDDIDKLLVKQPPPNPDAMATQSQIAVEQGALQLKKEELAIRGAREAGDLAIRRGKDKAIEIREMTQAILNLANAKKADSEADIGWIDIQMRHMQMQIEALNAGSEQSSDDPAIPAGDTGGPVGGTVQPMAAPTGNPLVPAMGQ